MISGSGRNRSRQFWRGRRALGIAATDSNRPQARGRLPNVNNRVQNGDFGPITSWDQEAAAQRMEQVAGYSQVMTDLQPRCLKVWAPLCIHCPMKVDASS
ncbi:hypothetical protein chiPu_0023628 [Chiloscyllium punctatum]|uniref:Uncharacterized protein n=1 Tax=Chiloscyllium punctatum TaxID=137246 RepID=A0A401TAG8_CHIPU|nr:hypothetical protein [Chiloscyllium punctatum]